MPIVAINDITYNAWVCDAGNEVDACRGISNWQVKNVNETSANGIWCHRHVKRVTTDNAMMWRKSADFILPRNRHLEIGRRPVDISPARACWKRTCRAVCSYNETAELNWDKLRQTKLSEKLVQTFERVPNSTMCVNQIINVLSSSDRARLNSNSDQPDTIFYARMTEILQQNLR